MFRSYAAAACQAARTAWVRWGVGDAMRQAYEGHYFNTLMVEGLAVAVGMAVIFLWLGSRVFLRENA